MKKSPIIVVLALFACLISTAQIPQATPLKDGDVAKFIRTYEPLKSDLEGLGEEFDEAKDFGAMQALAANEKVKSIFQKHGWDDQWIGKFMSISIAYSLIKIEKEVAALPEEERKQQEQYMAAYSVQMKSMITDADIEKVKKKFDELDPIFLEEENEDY